MRESILALSERAESLKLLRLERTGKGLALTGFAQGELPPQATAEDFAALAAQLAAAHGLSADRVVLGLDGGQAVLRRLRFPFTSPGKIDLVLGPEFEPFLAGAQTESAFCWVATALTPAPAAVALAGATPLAPLVERVAALTAAGLPPSAACLDLAGLDAALAARAPKADAALCVSLLDGRADFACRWGNAPLAWRSLAAPTGDPATLAAFLSREAVFTLSPLASQPPHSLALTLVGQAVDAAQSLEHQLATTATPLAALPGWPTLADGTPLPDDFAAAYGLALLAAKGPGTANFLRGELTPALSRSSLRRSILLAGGSLALLVVCAVTAIVASYWRLDAAIAKAQDETGAIVAKAAPELASGLTLPQKLSVLRGRLSEQAASARERAGSGTGTALEVLAAIHAGLGPGGQVKARRVAADESRVTIDAVADDYTTVDAVKRRLAAMPVFSNVDIKGAKNVPDKKQVEFQLDLKLAGSRESGS